MILSPSWLPLAGDRSTVEKLAELSALLMLPIVGRQLSRKRCLHHLANRIMDHGGEDPQQPRRGLPAVDLVRLARITWHCRRLLCRPFEYCSGGEDT